MNKGIPLHFPLDKSQMGPTRPPLSSGCWWPLPPEREEEQSSSPWGTTPSPSNGGLQGRLTAQARKRSSAAHSGLPNNCGFLPQSNKGAFNVLYMTQQMQDASGKAPLDQS